MMRKKMYWFSTPITFDRAMKIAKRKSIWMKLYLEARRSGDNLKGYFRRQHFRTLEQERRP